jgi:GNAT superfamily N-acetyltransferase
MIIIRSSTAEDLGLLLPCDRHIAEGELARILASGRVLLTFDGARLAGWLRYGLFWDEIPMANLLFIQEGERGRGYGRALVTEWERRMRAAGHRRAMTSTQADEDAQHFWRRLGYRDAGALLLPEQATELLLLKELPEGAGQGSH